MLHKWLEEWHDTIVYLGAIFGLLGFFLAYWKGEYQNRYAELVLQEFLSTVTVSGKITLEGYENFKGKINKINPAYEVDISSVEYEQKPVYALLPEEEIVQYYMSRNRKAEAEFNCYEPAVKEDPELLCLQEESAGELLASGQNRLPLPREDAVLKIEALKPVQKVYEGEELVTICHVITAEEEYYAKAESVSADVSGTIYLELMTKDSEYRIPVQVVCYPRIVICENGHEVVNSKDILSENKLISKERCPYCKVVPEAVSASAELLWKETGAELTGQDIGISVVYMNGATEYVTPDDLEWQDSYDENYCGVQQVTVYFRGKEDTFTVVSENKGCIQCGKACNERCYNDYISFPYCIKCLSEVELFTGKVHDAEKISSLAEIITCLDVQKEKCFKQGDFVRVYLLKGDSYVSYFHGKIKQDGRIGEY